MDILRFIDITGLVLIRIIFITILSEISHTSSIFEIILSVQPPVCFSFTNPTRQSIGDQTVIYPPLTDDQVNYEYTISTPKFPLHYPPNIQCVFVIKAPDYDYSIVLEVRKMFDVEPSRNCARDFLEIADGPFGFSRKIGRFCNSQTPPKEVRSMGPFLWLRFRSDIDLPHKGFTIVYRFIRKMMVEPKLYYCYSQVLILPDSAFNFNTSFVLRKLQDSLKFQGDISIPVECVFDFHVKPGSYTFANKAIFKKSTSTIPCHLNRLEIYHKGTFGDDILSPFKRNYFRICEGSEFDRHLFKYSTRTTFRIIIQDINKMNIFSFILTPIKTVKDNCSYNDFMCSTTPKLCISKHLVCNDELNCPDNSDENCYNGKILPLGQEITTISSADYKKPSTTSEVEKNRQETNRIHAIILGTIGSMLVMSIVFCLILTIRSKKKDKAKGVTPTTRVVSGRENYHSNYLFYDLLETSEPNIAALSTDKSKRKVFVDNHLWSKNHLQHDDCNDNTYRTNDTGYKLNGDVRSDFTNKSTNPNVAKKRFENTEVPSNNKIGKYLSVPYPVKSQIYNKATIPQSYNVSPLSEDFQSWSSHSISKPTSNAMKSIPRASSMGSGLRRKLNEPVNTLEVSKNVEWYCDPIIKGETSEIHSSEKINASSSNSSKHLPGCRSLPNFSNIELQNIVYYTKPISSNAHFTDQPTCSIDYNLSSSGEVPQYYVEKQRQNHNSPKCLSTTQYGYAYFCVHEPRGCKSDFVEYNA